MSSLHWYRQSLAWLGAAAVLSVLVLSTRERTSEGLGDQELASILSFEQDSLARIHLHRQGESLGFERRADEWESIGHDWRPRQTLLRRASYQLHDLRQRETLDEPTNSFETYGLGASRTQVELILVTGKVHRLNIGAPTPSGISQYVNVEGYSDVYLVKRAAVEYLGSPFIDFRDDHPFMRDVANLKTVTARLGDSRRSWERRDEGWFLSDDELGTGVIHDSRGFEEGVARLLEGAVSEFLGPASGSVSDEACGQGLILLGFQDSTEQRFCAVEGDSADDLKVFWSGDREWFRLPLRAFEWAWDDYGLGQMANPFATVAKRARWLELEVEGERVRIERELDSWRWVDESEVLGSTPELLLRSLEGLKLGEARDKALLKATETARMRIGSAAREVNVTFFKTRSSSWVQRNAEDRVLALQSSVWEHISALVNEHNRHERRKSERQGGVE